MKRRTITVISLALALVFLVSLVSCSGKKYENRLEEVKDRGSIIVATEGDWAPWTYHNETDNKLVGFDVELAELIADKLGVKVEYKETDWDSILSGVSSGRFDIACNGVSYTEERAKSYHFSTPYVYTNMVLVVRSDEENIKTFEDLEGKKTANTASSIYAEYAQEYGAEVTPVNTLQETIDLLVQGRIDATVNAKESIDDYLAQHPDAGIKIIASAAGDKMVIPVKNDDYSKPLIDEINKILDELRQNGKLAELSKKYFGSDITKA